MLAAHKFVQKFWILHLKIMNILNSGTKLSKINYEYNKQIEIFTNQTVNKVTNNLRASIIMF